MYLPWLVTVYILNVTTMRIFMCILKIYEQVASRASETSEIANKQVLCIT